MTLSSYLKKWGYIFSCDEWEVDEDLPKFYETIKLSQAHELVSENMNLKDKYGIELREPDNIEKLEK